MTPLRRRMIEDMRIRNLSPHTQRAYVEQVSRFARHFGQPSERLGQDEIRAWQIYLVEERRLAASSISIAVAALRFVYTVSLKRPWVVEEGIPTSRQPKKLPVVQSPEEVSRFLDAVRSPKHRMSLTVCYATGLRISEAVSLKPAVIDSQRMVIRVEAGKGRKDRYVMLSPTLLLAPCVRRPSVGVRRRSSHHSRAVQKGDILPTNMWLKGGSTIGSIRAAVRLC